MTITQETYEEIVTALQFADTFMQYVQDKDPVLYEEAVGIPNAREQNQKALATLQPEISGGEHDVVKDAINEHIFGE